MVNEDDAALDVSLDLSSISADLVAVTSDIETAFRETSEIIAQELKSAARSGEADFSAMARSIAEELATLALERVFSGQAVQDHQTPMTVNVSMPQTQSHSGGGAGQTSANAIASMIAQAVLRGSRFS